MGLFGFGKKEKDKMKDGLEKTRTGFWGSIMNTLTGSKIDDDLYDELEEQLILADVGGDVAIKLVDALRDRVQEKGLKTGEQAADALRGLIADEMRPEAEMALDGDIDEGLVEKVARGVKNRKKGEAIRFVYDQRMPEEMLRYLKRKFRIDRYDACVGGSRYHNMKDLMAFPDCSRSDLKFEKRVPAPVPSMDSLGSALDEIRRRDVFMHYPYHSFSNYIKVLREAALSRDVRSIKTTVYRLAKDSKVVKALICAAKHGKKVTVMVELMARFDEASNIGWSKKMQDAGIQVLFGVEGLKVHCKLTHIASTKGNVACISTGNPHCIIEWPDCDTLPLSLIHI